MHSHIFENDLIPDNHEQEQKQEERENPVNKKTLVDNDAWVQIQSHSPQLKLSLVNDSVVIHVVRGKDYSAKLIEESLSGIGFTVF